MKTAEELHKIYASQNYDLMTMFRLVQADALEYAIEIARAYESQTGLFIARTLQNKMNELQK